MKKRETKLDAWRAWCAIAGTKSIASEFTLENSSHGKAFSYAWDAGTQAEREACAHLVASKPTANRETKQVLQQCAASIKERKTHERTNAPIGFDHADVELAVQDARATQEGSCLVQEARTGKEVKPTGSIGMSADETQVGGSHYKDMPVQPWAVMEAVLTHEEFVGFLKGNIIKYSMRQGKKDGSTDDADKAQHYLQKLKEVNDGNAWI